MTSLSIRPNHAPFSTHSGTLHAFRGGRFTPRAGRGLALICLVLFLAQDARAQAHEFAQRYWIVSSETVPAPPPTERALERRAARGSGTPAERVLAPSSRADLLALGIVPTVESRWLGAVSAPLTAAQRETVAALPWVREVRPVARLSPAIAPSPPLPLAFAEALPRPLDYGASATQLTLVGADALLEAGYTGEGVLLGYLDSLFDFSHPAFSALVADDRLLGVQDFTGQIQSNYHGLATTSVGVGLDEGDLVGPAYGAQVLAATTEYGPSETHNEEDYFIAGLEWLESQGVDVVSISLGYSTFDEGEGDYTYADMDGDTTPVTRAADRAASLGVVVVTSAGNEGSSAWRYITAPADGDSVITVGGVTPTGAHAAFSSYGPTADGRTKPDVVAQSNLVVYANEFGGYSQGYGTSFSAPMVAGIAAQLLQARPSLTPMQLRDAFRETASQATAPDNSLGWGIVNAQAALDYAIATASESAPETLWQLSPNVVRAGDRLVVRLPVPTALEVFDLLGRRVAIIPETPPGQHSVTVPLLPSGAYVVYPTAGSLRALRLTILR